MNFYLNWHRNYVRLKLKACFLLSEFASSKFDLIIISVPVEIESPTVSHFKATINAKVEPEGLECDGIFISY